MHTDGSEGHRAKRCCLKGQVNPDQKTSHTERRWPWSPGNVAAACPSPECLRSSGCASTPEVFPAPGHGAVPHDVLAGLCWLCFPLSVLCLQNLGVSG